MSDQFFYQERCDRCPNDLRVRIMSWFNNDTICMDCAAKEKEIKSAMKEHGVDPAEYEGCGYVPTMYRIGFKLADGTQHVWERFGNDMNECFTVTKEAIDKEHGEQWKGGAWICPPQGDSGVYCH